MNTSSPLAKKLQSAKSCSGNSCAENHRTVQGIDNGHLLSNVNATANNAKESIAAELLAALPWLADHLKARRTANLNSSPETFRMPKSGQKDIHFGMTRSFWYQAESEGRLNLKRVKSRGKARGIVLIPYEEARNLIFGTTPPAEA